MDMLELLLLALALSMDAVAISIGLGTKYRHQLMQTGLLCVFYFGVAQGVMPLLGYLLGRSLLGFIADVAPWIACIILLALGGKMLYEAFTSDADGDNGSNGDADNDSGSSLTHRAMLMLAVTTSIDAMAAGFTLNVLSVNAYLACALIAITTAVTSFIGVFLGQQSGHYLESKAEIFGGVVLIAIAIKVVWFF